MQALLRIRYAIRVLFIKVVLAKALERLTILMKLKYAPVRQAHLMVAGEPQPLFGNGQMIGFVWDIYSWIKLTCG